MGCHDEGVEVALIPRGYESFGFPFVAKTIMTTIRQQRSATNLFVYST